MALNTYSKFFYGIEVTDGSKYLNFSEGGPELSAILDLGLYSLTEFVDEIVKQLNGAGALVYTGTIDRATGKITISATASFEILAATGSQLASGGWAQAGFTTDRTGASSYQGNLAGCKIYYPQFKLQNYIPSDNWQKPIDASVNKSTSGLVEVVRFGVEKFMGCELMFITNIGQPSPGPIKNNASGVANTLDFLTYSVQKGHVEFMPDENTPSTFETLMLESTEESSDGLAFKLIEETVKNLPGYYRSGNLTFKKIEG